MKGGSMPQDRKGYTIIEVMIVLAVTAGLFVAIMATISGQQGRTQFTAAARDMESRVQDIINDVSTGYYTTNNSFRCTAGASGPQITAVTPGSVQQGTNQGCTFIGRVVHFEVAGAPTDQFNVYSVAGLRQVREGTTLREPLNLGEARPTVVGPITQRETFQGGLRVERLYYQANAAVTAPRINIDAIGLFTTFGSYDPVTGDLNPGSLSVNVVPIIGNGAGTSNEASMAGFISSAGSAPIDPAGGATICFRSGGSDQHALLKIGGGSRQLTTEMTLGGGACP